ncbi:unnamed protein product [Clonostachys rosea f. rosea IK726]|uniref:Uncharacterized protein n=2 Tax=Bionectria ochroleuca TaxID=29856 RepID=A0A0B7KRI7_BIOOC|nr:unnamed protein product [Clonostachys rosea f. rosea IK726]
MVNSHTKNLLKTNGRTRGSQQQEALLSPSQVNTGGNTSMDLIANQHTSDKPRPDKKPTPHEELDTNAIQSPC